MCEPVLEVSRWPLPPLLVLVPLLSSHEESPGLPNASLQEKLAETTSPTA